MMVAQTNTPRLKTLFEESVVPKLKQEFGLTNLHQLPAIDKVIVNCGIGRFLENQKLKSEIRDTVYDTLSTITGQRPITLLARKSVSNFKVREGAPSAMMVTLRRDHMWHFLDRLINLAMPRIKDFRGMKDTSFDEAGNYGLGLTEQAVWPEINMAHVNFVHGMNINICLSRSNPAKSLFLLRELGLPFVRHDEN
ncbi:MAG: 50S ribosomal protein L5 [Planctomycetota bacterium]|nr:50S ribosomal protein L5 [Planctomycetota bacterium]